MSPRRAFRYGPPVLAALLLTALWMLRTWLFSALVLALIEEQVELAVGAETRFEARRVKGSWISGAVLEDFRFSVHTAADLNGARTPAVVIFTAARVDVGYRLLVFFSGRPLDALTSLSAHGGSLLIDPAAAGGGAESVSAQDSRPLPGPVLSEFIDTFPSDLIFELETDMRFAAGRRPELASTVPPAVRLRIGGNLRGGLRVAAELLEDWRPPSAASSALPEGSPLEAGHTVGLVLSADDPRISARTLPAETSLPVDIRVRMRLTRLPPDAGEGEAIAGRHHQRTVIAAAGLMVDAGPLHLELDADPREASLSVLLSPEGARPTVVLSERPRVQIERAEVLARARYSAGQDLPVLDLIMVDPARLRRQIAVEVQASYSGASVSGASVGTVRSDRGSAVVSWDGEHDRATIRSLHAQTAELGSIRAQALVLRPGGGFPLESAGRVWAEIADAAAVLRLLSDDARLPPFLRPLRISLSATSITRSPRHRSRDAAYDLVVDRLEAESPALTLDAEAGLSLSRRGVSVRLLQAALELERRQTEPETGPIRMSLGEPAELAWRLIDRAGGSNGQMGSNGQTGSNGSKGPTGPAPSQGASFTFRIPALRALGGTLRAEGRTGAADAAAPAEVTLTAGAEAVRLEELFPALGLRSPFTGALSADLAAEGPPAHPRLRLSMSTEGVTTVPGAQAEAGETAGQRGFWDRTDMLPLLRGIGGSPGRLTLELTQDERGLSIGSLEVDLGGALSLSGAGRLPAAVGSGGIRLLDLEDADFRFEGSTDSFDAWLPEDSDLMPGDSSLVLIMSLERGSRDLRTSLILRGGSGSAATGPRSSLDFRTLTLDARLTERPGDLIEVQAAMLIDLKTALSLRGATRVPGLSRGAPVFDPLRLSLDYTLDIDLPLEDLIAFVPGVLYMEGRVEGAMNIRGSLAAPEVVGDARIVRGALRTEGDLPTVNALTVTLALAGTQVSLERFRGELGYEPFTVSGGVTLPTESSRGALTLHLSGRNLLLFSQPEVRARGDCELEAKGDFDGVDLHGSIDLTDLLYRADIPLIDLNAPPTVKETALQLFSVPGDFAGGSRLDVAVRADRTVRVRNNLFSGDLSVSLHLGGTLAVPVPTGWIQTQDSRLLLPLTRLEVRQARVRFPEEAPFSPEVQAFARTEMRGYELLVQAEGTLPSIDVQVSSTPPLPQDQALLLLTTGYADIGPMGTGEQTVRTLGALAGRQLVRALFGRGQPAEETWLERVDVVIGKNVSAAGMETVEVEFRLGSGENWYLQFERDRYDRYNLDLAWRLWFR